MKSRNKDHKPHESIIGKIIYGFLLFMPLLAIGVTCAYAIFNKNAYQSYYGETINETSYVSVSNLRNDLKLGNSYYCNKSAYTNNFGGNTGSYNNGIIVSDFKLIETSRTDVFDYSKVNKISPYYNTQYNGRINIELFNDVDSPLLFTYGDSLTFTFTYEGNNLNNDWLNSNFIFEIEYNQNSFIDNVFYYSIDKVQQSPLFNWAENSVIYTGMANTCNAIDITTPFIPLLMTYWLIISVIYILYDIILVVLHIFHKKIHQLEDSF